MMLHKSVVATLSLMLLMLCSPLTGMAGPLFGGGCGGQGACKQKLEPLSEAEKDGLAFMREEEKMARDIYLTMYDEWELMIFDNIASSEQTHMDAVEALLDKHGLPDPVVDEGEDGIGVFVDPELDALYKTLKDRGLQSAMEALKVGGVIEETDLLDIQDEINLATHDDIISTYTNLLCGSMNHLRAFVTRIESEGGTYDPILLSDDELAAIVSSPTALNCGSLD